MPGLFVLRPLAPSRADNAKSHTATSRQEKSTAGKAPSARFSGMSSKVMPLPFPESQELTPKSARDETPNSQIRAKQVSDPLGESVKARICDSRTSGLQRFSSNASSSSSGSEHELSSVCLAAMVYDFMEEDVMPVCGRVRCNCESGTCNGYGGCGSDDDDDTCSAGELADILQGLSQCVGSMEKRLLVEVTAAVKMAKEIGDVCNPELGHCTGACLRRAVMSKLRSLGYNAAICKSRWDHSRGFPGGDYEYIDIMGDSLLGKDRILIDLDFRGQFQIARPTHQYSSALAAISSIFVGRVDRLQQIVNIMTDSTKRSLKKRGMHLPPWRKPEYMRAKWLAPYKRTTNEVSQAGVAIGCKAYATLQAAAGTLAGLRTDIEESRDQQGGEDCEIEAASSFPEDMDLDREVDAVIYKGKVFPVTDAGMRENVQARRDAQCHKGVTPNKQVTKEARVVNTNWQPPAIKSRTRSGGQLKAGLAALFKESSLAAQQKGQADDWQQVATPAFAGSS